MPLNKDAKPSKIYAPHKIVTISATVTQQKGHIIARFLFQQYSPV